MSASASHDRDREELFRGARRGGRSRGFDFSDDGGASRGGGRGRDSGVSQSQVYGSRSRTNDALRDALATANDTLAVGEATAEELARQREVLERTHAKVKSVDNMMDVAKYQLRGMSSFFGRVANAFSTAPKMPDATPAVDKAGTSTSTSGGARAGAGAGARGGTTARRGGEGSGSGSSGGRHAAAADGSSRSTAATERKTEEDALVDALGESISRLTDVARATGDELSAHNRIIDDIAATTDRADSKMRGNKKRMRKIVKGS